MKQLDTNWGARLTTYWRVWVLTTTNAAQIAFVNRWSNSLFLLGKTIRLVMSLVFLFLLKDRNISVAGYTSSQVIIFYLTYQLLDVTSQIFFRGVYVFGSKIRSGEFDFLMIKPISSLFRSLTGQPDLNDALFLIPNLLLMAWLLSQLDVHVTWWSVLWFIVIFVNSFLIVTALHILVLVMGVLTTEADNFIWIYRDLSRLGQFPITIYSEPVRSLLFFVVPIGLMITVPAQVLLNTPPSVNLGVAFSIGIGFFYVSLLSWRYALRHYTSASS